MFETNALAVEYQRDYGRARRYVHITNVMDKALLSRECSVFGPGFSEQISDLSSVQVRPFGQNAADAVLVVKNAI